MAEEKTVIKRRVGYWPGLEAEKAGLEARVKAAGKDAPPEAVADLNRRIGEIDEQLKSPEAKAAAAAARESRPG